MNLTDKVNNEVEESKQTNSKFSSSLITKEELKAWFYNQKIDGIADIKVEVQKRIAYCALEKTKQFIDEEKLHKINRTLECEFRSYPMVRDNGTADHLVFVPGITKNDGYYQMIMRSIKSDLGEEGSEVFEKETKNLINELDSIMEPTFKKYRAELSKFIKESDIKTHRHFGKYRLNQTEKSLVKKRMAKLVGHSPDLKLLKKIITSAEHESVEKIVNEFYSVLGKKAAKEKIGMYKKAYREMKQYLQIIPHFLDKLLNSFEGNLIFLDRDARMFYTGAKLFQKLGKGNNQKTFLVPVTRPMISVEYSEAIHEEIGGIPPMIAFLGGNVEYPSYSWSEKRINALEQKEKKREQLSKQGLIYAREEVVKTEKFRSNAEKLYSYLKHINALDADKITIVDMGMLGTATEYTCDVIKQFEPEKDVSSYLFFSRSTINSFIDEKIPNLKLNAVSYAAFYESFPKTIHFI